MNAGPFAFRILATDGAARVGEITTPHGVVRTPAFMPVGTAGSVKAMYPDQVKALGSDIILGNTYHLMLRPGAERIAALGGLHRFINWPGPILTDSGGFQVMSLARLRRVAEHGVTFQSHLDGAEYQLTPERAVEIQTLLGADIQMQLDECIALPAGRSEIERAMRLSLRWAERSIAAMGAGDGRALFGIVQGGDDAALRKESAASLTAMPFHGYAIGGLAVGEPQATILSMIEVTSAVLPPAKPRYLMGVGTPADIVEAVARGVDMFDCVLPTRAGRHGVAYTRHGRLNLRNARHADDPMPLDPQSLCPAARDYSRAFLHHLVKSGELLASMLLTWNNLAYYQSLMDGIRQAIGGRRLPEFARSFADSWRAAAAETPESGDEGPA
jgi:queuine tRNA-ribosyltransferase